MHGMLSWAPSKRVISYPLARRLRPEVIPVGSKIGNTTGFIEIGMYGAYYQIQIKSFKNIHQLTTPIGWPTVFVS